MRSTAQTRHTVDHSEVVLNACHALGFDIIRLEGIRCGGQSVFVAAGYTVYYYGGTSDTKRKEGCHGVGVATKESVLEEMGGKCTGVKCFSDQLMKVRLELEGKSNGVTFVIAYVSTKNSHKG